jgi:hypothetical protein
VPVSCVTWTDKSSKRVSPIRVPTDSCSGARTKRGEVPQRGADTGPRHVKEMGLGNYVCGEPEGKKKQETSKREPRLSALNLRL